MNLFFSFALCFLPLTFHSPPTTQFYTFPNTQSLNLQNMARPRRVSKAIKSPLCCCLMSRKTRAKDKYNIASLLALHASWSFAGSYIYTISSVRWIISTEIYVVGSNFNRIQGLFRECTYVGHTVDCELPYPNLVISSKPAWFVFCQFTMPVVCVLTFFSIFVYFSGIECLKKSSISMERGKTLLVGGIMLITGGVLGLYFCTTNSVLCGFVNSNRDF